MRWVVIGVVLGIAMAASAAAAEETQSAAKSQVAEINPVTGHVFCIRPQGAPVAPPPSDIAALRGGSLARAMDLGADLQGREGGNVSAPRTDAR